MSMCATNTKDSIRKLHLISYELMERVLVMNNAMGTTMVVSLRSRLFSIITQCRKVILVSNWTDITKQDKLQWLVKKHITVMASP